MTLWTSVKASASTICIITVCAARRTPAARASRKRRDVRERVETDRRDADEVAHVAEEERDRGAARERVLVDPHEEDQREDEGRGEPGTWSQPSTRKRFS